MSLRVPAVRVLSKRDLTGDALYLLSLDYLTELGADLTRFQVDHIWVELPGNAVILGGEAIYLGGLGPYLLSELIESGKARIINGSTN